MKITKQRLTAIARKIRRGVGVINSEEALAQALPLTIEQMANMAEEAGVSKAREIAENTVEEKKGEYESFPPGRKFRFLFHAIAQALKEAQHGPVSIPSRLKTGKRAELMVMAQMLAEGLDVYIPLVDDHGVDAIVQWKNGPFLQVQVKATGKDNKHPASFSIGNSSNREGKVFFALYSGHFDTWWVMPSRVVYEHARGAGSGAISIKLAILKGKRWKKDTMFSGYEAHNFDILKRES